MKQTREESKKISQAMIQGLCQGLKRPWTDYQQTLFRALEEIWNASQQEAQVTEAIARIMENASRELDPTELQFIGRRIQNTLGSIWDQVLDELERSYLCCGLRSMQPSDENTTYISGLILGRVVELSLLRRLYRPLKEQWSQDDRVLTLGEEWPAPKLAKFIAGDCHLTLGDMAGGFNRALAHVHEEPTELQGMIINYLRQLPNHPLLLDASLEVRKQRAQGLERIKELRNNCAHGDNPMPTEAELQTLWADVVEGPHAFFRYFGGAHLPLPAEAG